MNLPLEKASTERERQTLVRCRLILFEETDTAYLLGEPGKGIVYPVQPRRLAPTIIPKHLVTLLPTPDGSLVLATMERWVAEKNGFAFTFTEDSQS